MAGAALAIRLLGPFELVRGDVVVPAGGPTQRAVLAMLALHAGASVAIETLSEGIWGEGGEPAGRKAIQMHVSRLRRVLKDGRAQPLKTVPGGYRLAPEGVDIDSDTFERALDAGREQLAAGDPGTAVAELGSALRLWRGIALMDLRDFPFAAHVALRYDELRIDAAEAAIAARLALGEAGALVPTLQDLVASNPYRERLHAQLMTALYRAGQQAAALDAYTAARNRLVLDLGVEPGAELAKLQQQILTQDPALAVQMTAVAAATPELHVVPHAPARLPAAPLLFGRDDLLAELEGMTRTERLLTLTGAGGSGKTVLALALAHRLKGDYADGAAFVDLAAVTRHNEVLPAIASAMAITPQRGSLAEQLAEVVAERRMLIVLDNCEHLLDAVPDLAPLVDATSGLLLATSRAPLGLRAEHVVAVPPLPLPEPDEDTLSDEPAIVVFMRAAANAGVSLPADELQAVTTICRAVDGLPLAIELVAAQTRIENVGELAATLHDRLPGLAATARDVPSRQRTMEAAIGWSLERLTARQRRAFRRLAVFAGGFDARGAAVVLERDRSTAIAQLSALLDASLLVRRPSAAGQARFRMLEPIRDVARTHSPPDELEATRRRHAEFMASEAERLSPPATGIQRPEDLAQLRLEHPNLMAAMEYLAGADPDRGVELLVQLEEYWAWTGADRMVQSLAARLVSAGGLTVNSMGNALAMGAEAAEILGDLELARDALARASQLIDGLTDEAALARLSQTEALIIGDGGDWERAKTSIRQALTHAERSGNRRLVAFVISGWAAFAEDSDSYIERLEAALSEARAQSMGLTEAIILRALFGTYVFVQQDEAKARDAARAALALANRFEAPEFAAHLATNLGAWEVRFGSPASARPLLLSALRTMDRIGHRSAVPFPLGALAEAEASRGHWKNALILFGAEKAQLESMGLLGALHPDDVAAEAVVIRTAEEHVGPEAAAKARAMAEAMSYREAVDFALQAH